MAGGTQFGAMARITGQDPELVDLTMALKRLGERSFSVRHSGEPAPSVSYPAVVMRSLPYGDRRRLYDHISYTMHALHERSGLYTWLSHLRNTVMPDTESEPGPEPEPTPEWARPVSRKTQLLRLL